MYMIEMIVQVDAWLVTVAKGRQEPNS